MLGRSETRSVNDVQCIFILFLSVFEYKALAKCSMSPELFDFFSNNSKFLCFLPAKFNQNMLRYPSVRALMNYREQNVHVLCPGLSKYQYCSLCLLYETYQKGYTSKGDNFIILISNSLWEEAVVRVKNFVCLEEC